MGGAGVEFSLFVILAAIGEAVPVQIVPAREDELQVTRRLSEWTTDWTSESLVAPTVEKYAAKAANGELIALGVYQIRGIAPMCILFAQRTHRLVTQLLRPKGAGSRIY